MDSGIYKITNIITNQIYIGSSCKLSTRKYAHFYQLEKNIHPNKYLQSSYNKYSKEAFDFEIIAVCLPEYCIKLEQWFIDNLKPEYNILLIAGNSLGYKHSKETLKKLKELSKSYCSKKVYQYDLNDSFIKEWDSCTQFGKYYNISRIAVTKAIKKGHKCRGYIISYNPPTLC